MVMVHPNDWKTQRIARVLANAMVPGQWDQNKARRALDLLLHRGYSYRDAWQLATGFYPLTLEEFNHGIN